MFEEIFDNLFEGLIWDESAGPFENIFRWIERLMIFHGGVKSLLLLGAYYAGYGFDDIGRKIDQKYGLESFEDIYRYTADEIISGVSEDITGELWNAMENASMATGDMPDLTREGLKAEISELMVFAAKYSDAQKLKLVMEYKEGGKGSMAAFAKSKGVPASTFRAWVKNVNTGKLSFEGINAPKPTPKTKSVPKPVDLPEKPKATPKPVDLFGKPKPKPVDLPDAPKTKPKPSGGMKFVTPEQVAHKPTVSPEFLGRETVKMESRQKIEKEKRKTEQKKHELRTKEKQQDREYERELNRESRQSHEEAEAAKERARLKAEKSKAKLKRKDEKIKSKLRQEEEAIKSRFRQQDIARKEELYERRRQDKIDDDARARQNRLDDEKREEKKRKKEHKRQLRQQDKASKKSLKREKELIKLRERSIKAKDTYSRGRGGSSDKSMSWFRGKGGRLGLAGSLAAIIGFIYHHVGSEKSFISKLLRVGATVGIESKNRVQEKHEPRERLAPSGQSQQGSSTQFLNFVDNRVNEIFK